MPNLTEAEITRLKSKGAFTRVADTKVPRVTIPQRAQMRIAKSKPPKGAFK